MTHARPHQAAAAAAAAAAAGAGAAGAGAVGAGGRCLNGGARSEINCVSAIKSASSPAWGKSQGRHTPVAPRCRSALEATADATSWQQASSSSSVTCLNTPAPCVCGATSFTEPRARFTRPPSPALGGGPCPIFRPSLTLAWRWALSSRSLRGRSGLATVRLSSVRESTMSWRWPLQAEREHSFPLSAASLGRCP